MIKSAGSIVTVFLLVTSIVLNTRSTEAQKCASELTSDQLNARVNGLIEQMTPEERIAQMQDRAPAISRLHIPAYNWWNEGLHGIARNGYATVFPQAIGLAATFDPLLLNEVGDVVSTEARAKFNAHRESDSPRYAGLTIWSPNINIFRDPRWGRGQETYGEDPFLTGELGVQFVRGLQGNDRFYRKADATPKHFAVHSGPESIRDGFNSIVSEHDLADTYLAAFRRLTVDAHADAIMCSYNAINGIPACANTALLQDRVRAQWGFGGYLVSDCDAIDEVTEYLHFTSDQSHGAAASLKAGVDLNCGSTYAHLNESLSQGLIKKADIDHALYRLVLARIRMGMLESKECSSYTDIAASNVDTAQDRSLALRAAEESMVLLRNDSLVKGALDKSTERPSKALLPINFHGKRIAIIGPTADLLSVIEANYHGTIRNPETLLDGLKHGLPKDTQIAYAQGSMLADGITIPIPPTAFRSGSLRGEYFLNDHLTGKPFLSREDAHIDFDFDHIVPGNTTLDDNSTATYSIRWSGELIPPSAGSYRLRVAVDRCFDCKGHDAYKLWLDGKIILEDDGTRDNMPDSVKFDWTDVHPHPLRLELLHSGADQGIHLEWQAPAATQLSEALDVARKSDLILALVGLSPELEGEALRVKIPGFSGGDREDLGLPEAQRNLLAALASLHKPIIIGITSGSAVATGDVTSTIDAPMALIQLWYPGEEGGGALANLLTGRKSPSGRLPVTVYKHAGDLPAFTDYSMSHRTYRYFDGPVDFPFGFGLSYTTFRFSKPMLSTTSLAAGRSLTVHAVVTNTGKVAGDEVAELYLIPAHLPGALKLTLQGIQRLYLKPGESHSVEFTLTPRQLSLVDSQGKRAVRAGSYYVSVSGKQPNSETFDTDTSIGFSINGNSDLEP